MSLSDAIEAIYFDDFAEVLPNFIEDFNNGRLCCSCCGSPLNKVGLSAVEVEGQQFLWICARDVCAIASVDIKVQVS